MSVREQHHKRKMQDVRDAINVLRGDGGYDNLDCGILSLTRFRDEVRSLLIEGVGATLRGGRFRRFYWAWSLPVWSLWRSS